MKKMLIAAAIVCAAVVSQGASFRWRANGIQNAAGTAAYSGTATLHVLLTGTSTEVATKTAQMSNGAINTIATIDSLTVGTFYDFYYTLTSGTSTFTSGDVTNIQAQSTSTPSLGFSSTGSWSTPSPEPTPEPTSAILMLVGMAGLALRRRRA